MQQQTVLETDPFQDVDGFKKILDGHGVTYSSQGYYLQVGEITKVQGWILHVSVVISQVMELLQTVIPELIAARVPFKIPVNAEAADLLLGGMLGYINVGKVISIYPENEEEAVRLAQQLMLLTGSFKGPEIPTDTHLGGTLYTRYGSFNPILQTDADGRQLKFIYNSQGQLVQDDYTIPAVLPVGISWPFASINPFTLTPRKKFLNDRIKPVSVIKADVKGNVIKGMYMKSWLQAKPCLIKEGKMNMCSDIYGRDIQDRLKWQLQLHNDLCSDVPIPRILDYFQEGNDLYLAMEFISGISLDEKIMAIYEGNSWGNLRRSKQLLLLDYLLQVLQIVQRLHEKGYVHRDISTGNFIIDKQNKLHIIDLEITYSTRLQEPNPCYGIGTYGFMPPEQHNREVPTAKEDIYELGALMIVLFTSLQPLKFETEVLTALSNSLYFFIPEWPIVELIVNCMHPIASERPELAEMLDTVKQYRNRLQQLSSDTILYKGFTLSEESLQTTIAKGLKGLCCELMTSNKGIWLSKTVQVNQTVGNPQASYNIKPGIYEGISGVLLMLAQIKKAGTELSPEIEAYYENNFAYLRRKFSDVLHTIPAGLYMGSAGVALAIGIGADAGLIANTAENKVFIYNCLDREPEGIDLVSGAAGLGLAILQCKPYLPELFASEKLQQLTKLICDEQQSDGNWTLPVPDTKKRVVVSGLSQGNSGIICFLLEMVAKFNDEQARETAIKALDRLQKGTIKRGNSYIWLRDSLNKEVELWVHNGVAGIALTFIKAYEVLGEPDYKKMAEGALNNYSTYITDRGLSHAWGKCGLGEVYLEAWRVFEEERWKNRAEWIAGSLLHLQKRHEDVCYWLTDVVDIYPTADLMTGNSGVIHFLSRCMRANRSAYPLFNAIV